MCWSLSASITKSPGTRSLLWRPCFTAVLWWRRRRYARALPGLCVRGQSVQTAQDLLRCLSQHALNVTHKAVDVAFARRLVDDVLVVVVTQATAQLLVVHLGFVLAPAPALGHLRDQQKPQRVQLKCVYSSEKRRINPPHQTLYLSKSTNTKYTNSMVQLKVLHSE